MPAGKPKRTSAPSPARRSTKLDSGRGASVSRGTSLLESLELVRAEFDEACEHVLAVREFTGFRLGPLTDVPMAQLAPGVFGWRRVLNWGASDGRRSTGNDAELYYLVVPGFDLDWSSPDGETPLRGRRWKEFVAAQESLGPPKSVFLASARSEADRPMLVRFVERLQQEFAAGD
jgi:hypothetical protein